MPDSLRDKGRNGPSVKSRRINPLDDPPRLLRQRNAARNALAEIVRATYDDDLPDHMADKFRGIAMRGVNAR